MKINAPKKTTLILAVILAVLGVIGAVVHTIPFLSAGCVWLLCAGFVVLLGGNLLKGF